MVPVLVSIGIDWHKLTTWGALWNAIIDVISNPVAVIAILVGIYTSRSTEQHQAFQIVIWQKNTKPNKD